MAQPPNLSGSFAADNARRNLVEASALAAAGRLGEAERAMTAAEGLYGRPPHNAEPWTRSPEFLAMLREASTRVGEAYLASGDVLAALSHLAHAVILGADEAVQSLFISLLLKVRFNKPHALAKSIVQRALEERWIDPSRLVRLAARLLCVEPGARELSRGSTSEIAPSTLLTEPISAFLRESLLLTLLDSDVVMDPDLERVLTLARRALLQLVRSGRSAPDGGLDRFAAALANQGFANEYAWAISETEAVEVEALRATCAEALAGGHAPNALELATLAAYRPLGATLDVAALRRTAWPQSLVTTIIRQVHEPLAEEALKRDLTALTNVEDPGSRAVRRQYEENPYPRWVSAPTRRRPMPLLPWITQNFSGAPDPTLDASRRYEVLIAGCGTGIETAAFVQSFNDVEVLAVDLSLTSLAHAQRRAGELGLKHLTFAQADLLELGRLDRRFDVVVSSGVLHHLDDPQRGLAALRAVTRPGGFLILALYSRLGRRSLEPARAFGRELGLDASPGSLRRYRTAVQEMPAPRPAWRDQLLGRDDFYSLSSLRDLLFHVRESVFDTSGIAAMLETCGLRFAGFQIPPEVASAHAERFGERTDALSLDQWGVFEAERPDTFQQMYFFLAQRPIFETELSRKRG